jgi:hypothetical protein
MVEFYKRKPQFRRPHEVINSTSFCKMNIDFGFTGINRQLLYNLSYQTTDLILYQDSLSWVYSYSAASAATQHTVSI